MPPLNIITVSTTFVAKGIIFSCGSDRAKRAIEVNEILNFVLSLERMPLQIFICFFLLENLELNRIL